MDVSMNLPSIRIFQVQLIIFIPIKFSVWLFVIQYHQVYL